MATIDTFYPVNAHTSTWDECCELGRKAAISIDVGRWTIGDLACEVEKHYHRHMIDDFAREINVGKERVKSYRTVSRFYSQKNTRYDFLDEHPNLTWTHFRIAMSAGDTESAYELLEECSAQGYTTDELAYHLSNRKGEVKETEESAQKPPRRWQGLIVGLYDGQVTIKLKIDEYSDFAAWAKNAVEIVIQELDS